MKAKIIQLFLCLVSLITLASCASAPYGQGDCSVPARYARQPHFQPGVVADQPCGPHHGYPADCAQGGGMIQTGGQLVQTGEERTEKHEGYLVQERDSATGKPIGKPFWVAGDMGNTLNGKPVKFNEREYVQEKDMPAFLDSILDKQK